MSNKKVSVLICTYNCENYIENTLNSVLDQTYKNYKILICENNSKDKTKNILKQFEKKYPKKIKVYYQSKNLGAYGGLNYLLDRTNSKYIAIQDHDDLWHPNKLKEQIKFLDKHNEFVGCGTGAIYYYEKYKKYKIEYNTTKFYFGYHPSIIYRYTSKRYPKEEYLADCKFIKEQLCNNQNKIYNLKKPYLLHIIRTDSKNYISYWIKSQKIKNIYKENTQLSTIKIIYNYIIPFKIRVFMSIYFFSRKKLKNIKKLKNNKYTKCYLKYI